MTAPEAPARRRRGAAGVPDGDRWVDVKATTSTPTCGGDRRATTRRRTSAPGTPPSRRGGPGGHHARPDQPRPPASAPSPGWSARSRDYLGNTPAVCRASYIDPRVIDLFEPASPSPRRWTGLPTRHRLRRSRRRRRRWRRPCWGCCAQADAAAPVGLAVRGAGQPVGPAALCRLPRPRPAHRPAGRLTRLRLLPRRVHAVVRHRGPLPAGRCLAQPRRATMRTPPPDGSPLVPPTRHAAGHPGPDRRRQSPVAGERQQCATPAPSVSAPPAGHRAAPDRPVDLRPPQPAPSRAPSAQSVGDDAHPRGGHRPGDRRSPGGSRTLRTASGRADDAAGAGPSQSRSLVQVVAQLLRPARVPQLGQRLGLDLPDPLAGDAELLADLLERARVAVGRGRSAAG